MYDNNNIFAKILRGEAEAKIVYEDEKILAFHDKYPIAPVHILVVPKAQYISFDDFICKADTDEVAKFFRIVRKIAADLGLEESGYRIVTNHGENAGQVVFHFHIHIISGNKLNREKLNL
ncbi:putative HIT-like protein [Rickettsiales bacterium]|nr:putative HIT-like protein [Rickettsiales bacterium]